MNHSSCPVCNGSFFILKGYDDLVKCSRCKIIFQERIPTDEQLKEYYGLYPQYTQIDQETFDSYNKILKSLGQYRKHNNLLEVGCGNGFFLDSAKEKKWNVSGTELDEKSISICRQKGISIETDLTKFQDGDFDGAVMIEVIEHLKSPLEILSQL